MLIVQISDMHVSAPGRLFGKRVDSRAAFERTVSRVLTLNPAPAAVILSGDLAETGAPEEYDFIAAQIARLSCPVFAVPGNHDVRAEMLRKLPDCVTAQPGDHLSFASDALPIRLIGLDTIVPGQVHGEICAQRLAWLRGVLTQNQKPAMIAMHHPPFLTGLKGMDKYGIKRGLDEFKDIIAAHAKHIHAIVCGHAHRAITARIASVPVMMAPSCSFPFELALGETPSLNFVAEPPQFLVHTYDDDAGLVTHTAFVDAFPGPYSVL